MRIISNICEKVRWGVNWWPHDEYSSFRKLFLDLDQILVEQPASGNGGAG